MRLSARSWCGWEGGVSWVPSDELDTHHLGAK
jgi:hypothetical protein